MSKRMPQIGQAIQRERKARGLTLAQLSTMSGVSKSMLSQIERGETNPTFAVLWALTQALEIDLTDLVVAEANGSAAVDIEVVSRAHTPEIRSADGLCTLRILSPPRMAGEPEWYQVEIAPGGVLESAPHAPGTFEHFTALSQGIEITSADTTRRLEEGETARYPVDVEHSIANISAKTAHGLLVVISRRHPS